MTHVYSIFLYFRLTIPEGKRPLGRPRSRWVDYIRMDLQEVGCGYMDWIGLAQDRDRGRTLLSAVMNLRVPWNSGNFLTSCKPVSCSRRRGENETSPDTIAPKLSSLGTLTLASRLSFAVTNSAAATTSWNYKTTSRLNKVVLGFKNKRRKGQHRRYLGHCLENTHIMSLLGCAFLEIANTFTIL